MDTVYEIYNNEVCKKQDYTFEKYLYAFQLALLPGNTNYSRVLSNIKNYFDSEVLGEIVRTILQGIEFLNMEKTSGDKDAIRDALFSTFLLSNLDDEVTQDESSIFKHYKNTYVLMNVNSVLLKDVIQI